MNTIQQRGRKTNTTLRAQEKNIIRRVDLQGRIRKEMLKSSKPANVKEEDEKLVNAF
jgi:hypothetical protein